MGLNTTEKPLMDESQQKDALLKKNEVQQFEYENDLEKLKQKPPRDKWRIVYFIFLMHGIALLLPYNLFLTASDYYTKYKLNTEESKDSWYRRDFILISTLVGQIANVAMNALNVFVRCGNTDPKKKMPFAIMLSALTLSFISILGIIDSTTWPFQFFILTICSVVVTMVATGMYNTSIFYIASMFPGQYTNALCFGNNVAGIFTTLISMLSKASSPDLRTAGIYYFLSGVIVVLTCFVLYFLMPRFNFFRYYIALNEERNSGENASSGAPPYIYILRKVWVLLLCIWLCMFSTLAVFPVLQLGIQQVSDSFIISKTWFTDITCFLTFNICVTLGTVSTEFLPHIKPKWISIPVVLKAVLSILFFLFCNYQPAARKDIFPVLFANDYVYWAGCIIFPLVNGYLVSLLMMYTPRQVEAKHAGTTAMLSVLILVIGVVCGLNFTKVLEIIITKPQNA